MIKYVCWLSNKSSESHKNNHMANETVFQCTVGYCWRVDMESSPAFPSLPSASVMFLLVCQGSPYMSRAGCIIRISIRKMIGSPSSQKPVMRQLGHPRNEFNLPWSSPLDEPWRWRHDPGVLNTSTSLRKGLHYISDLFWWKPTKTSWGRLEKTPLAWQ